MLDHYRTNTTKTAIDGTCVTLGPSQGDSAAKPLEATECQGVRVGHEAATLGASSSTPHSSSGPHLADEGMRLPWYLICFLAVVAASLLPKLLVAVAFAGAAHIFSQTFVSKTPGGPVLVPRAMHHLCRAWPNWMKFCLTILGIASLPMSFAIAGIVSLSCRISMIVRSADWEESSLSLVKLQALGKVAAGFGLMSFLILIGSFMIAEHLDPVGFGAMRKLASERALEQTLRNAESENAALEFDLNVNDRYREWLRQLEPGLVSSVTFEKIGNDVWQARLTVNNLWHVRAYQLRLQDAQVLWQAWAGIRSSSNPDLARIKLVDFSGNEVGGSRALAGSLIWVQDR